MLDNLKGRLGFTHRVLSAGQFADATNAPDKYGFRGATMNPYTYEVAKVGKTQKHAVGGARRASGGRVATKYVDKGSENPQITPMQVLQHADRVKKITGNNPDVALGSWVETRSKRTMKQGVQVDASNLLPADTDPKVIRGMLKQRNEKESFNIADPNKSVRNYAWRKYNGQK